MEKDSKKKIQLQRNEGEGNKTAARRFNKEQRRFAESGRVGDGAREAERSREGAERPELDEAETIGRRHAAAEDPKVKRPYEKEKR